MHIETSSQLVDQLRRFVDDFAVAGLRIETRYTAPGVTVTPPAGSIGWDKKGNRHHGIFTLPDGRQGVTIDAWGAQARRWSLALKREVDTLGLPVINLVAPERDGFETTSYDWSHRQADAIFRSHASEVDEALKSAGSNDTFATIANADVEHADALLRWFPQALICGWWDSHTATEKKGSKTFSKDFGKATAMKLPEPERFDVVTTGARSARAMTSEIIAKGVSLRTRYASRIDPVFGAMPGGKGKTKISELGFGTVPSQAAPKDVTFESIEGSTWISLAILRRFGFHEVDPTTARAALVALALAGLDATAKDLHLRVGSDLIRGDHSMQILSHGGGVEELTISSPQIITDALAELSKDFGWSQLQVDVSGSKLLPQLISLAQTADETDESDTTEA